MSSETVARIIPCRTCSECDGHHHWIEICVEDDPDVDESISPWVGFGCKHCDLRSEQCLACENPAYPSPAGAEYCPDCVKDLS